MHCVWLNKRVTISVIVPVLNEKRNLPKLLEQLRHFSFEQVILVDGGSQDGSWQWLQNYQSTVQKASFFALQSETGRSNQMNAGAEVATADVVLFLHADTHLPKDAIEVISESLGKYNWGRFDIAFQESDWRMSIIAWCMNLRSRLTGVATGDQGIFVRRDVFEKFYGFANIPLMEDVELCKRLLKESVPACCSATVTTSARRWLKNGVIQTVVLMWRLRFSYFIGADPSQLALKYRQTR